MSVSKYFKDKLNKLEASINPTIKQTFDRNKSLIIDQQTYEQWYKGEDQKGSNLVPSYALSTKVVKKRKGQPFNRVTLNDTGDLYKSVKVDAQTNSMIISANVEYYKYLVAHYPKNQILGLQDVFLRQFVTTKVLPNLKKKFKDIISQ